MFKPYTGNTHSVGKMVFFDVLKLAIIINTKTLKIYKILSVCLCLGVFVPLMTILESESGLKLNGTPDSQ